MRSAFWIATTAAVLLFFGAGAPSAKACGFDGLLGGGFSAAHPRSMMVAFAISDAVAAGLIDKSTTDPILPGSAGYWRAVGRLNAFQRLLSSTPAVEGQSPAISILFIDSNLWARLSPGRQNYELQAHTSGALPGDTVIVTSEAILAALLNGTMQARTALDLGLITIDGDKAEAEIMRRAIVEAINRPAGVAGSRSVMPVRLFGAPR
ncbi:hypothetical protein [Bradyrhizobium sp. AUGA SZCCT0182]|uniref:hypothetical protein n=1 Tax=Bradyrhizobium sp. AUGA SZCCT0182 TaxID=2807667 RepID=UPI001BADA1BC|nr:hypothetical protein [Bradyrhizobium sp. AUGA SZCCT0182]MBR1235199.1 hypothetical protein [Bradyrhizobium sp. AUGA SZCCT0182]